MSIRESTLGRSSRRTSKNMTLMLLLGNTFRRQGGSAVTGRRSGSILASAFTGRSLPQSFTARQRSVNDRSANAFVRTFQLSSTISEPAASAPTPSSLKDESAASKSRRPFSAPVGSADDSVEASGEKSSWNKLGLLTELVDAVSKESGGLGLPHPTPVQRMAIPAILSGCSKMDAEEGEERIIQGMAFAAATGSGKTLAYLLPIIQSLKGQELLPASPDAQPLRRPKRPRAIILAPTRELSVQIGHVLKCLSHSAKISSQCIVGGEDYGKQRKHLENRPCDILVATPGRLVKHWNEKNVFLGGVRHVVVDEMDTMLEQGFQKDLGKVLNALVKMEQAQVILTTATLTNAVKRLLNHPEFPPPPKKIYKQSAENSQTVINLPSNLRIIEAPGLHRAVPRLRQVFIDVGQTDKLSLLIDVVQSHNRRSDTGDAETLPLTLVFCNTVASSRAAEHALAESGICSLGYHGDLNSVDRSENLKKFREAGSVSAEEESPRVLVCTDIASRGLDVPEVDHVVMFDFPLNSIDYLHRAGRTARGDKGEGKVTALVAKRDKVLAMAIEEAVQRGDPLDGLSSRKTDYLPGGSLERSGKKKKPEGKKQGNSHSRKPRESKRGISRTGRERWQ